jgi:hypothetical protein
MTVIKTYSSRLEAELANLTLSAAGLSGTVIGVGVGMEGGADGVRLLVPDSQAAAALKVLGKS